MKTSCCLFLLVILGAIALLNVALGAEIIVDGVVQDSDGKLLGGVDVTLYVTGTSDYLASAKTQEGTGRYELKASLSANFDIFYSASRYVTSNVALLAQNESQHVAKVLYLQEKPKPATAVNDIMRTISRVSFLATILNPADRRTFVDRFAKTGLFDEAYRKLDVAEPVSSDTLSFLEQQQEQTRKELSSFAFKK